MFLVDRTASTLWLVIEEYSRISSPSSEQHSLEDLGDHVCPPPPFRCRSSNDGWGNSSEKAPAAHFATASLDKPSVPSRCEWCRLICVGPNRSCALKPTLNTVPWACPQHIAVSGDRRAASGASVSRGLRSSGVPGIFQNGRINHLPLCHCLPQAAEQQGCYRTHLLFPR